MSKRNLSLQVWLSGYVLRIYLKQTNYLP